MASVGKNLKASETFIRRQETQLCKHMCLVQALAANLLLDTMSGPSFICQMIIQLS